LDNQRVLDVVESRKKEAAIALLEKIIKPEKRDTVQAAAMDM
jgi:hypothetical protein